MRKIKNYYKDNLYNKKLRELEKEARNERIALNKFKQQFKNNKQLYNNYNTDIKKNYENIIRYLNPAKIQLKQLLKEKITKKFRYIPITKTDEYSKATYNTYEKVEEKLSKKQIKKIEEFKKDFKRQTQNAIKRLNKYDYSFNINTLKNTYKGNEISLKEMFTNYINGNKLEKIAYRKLINKTFKKFKEIKNVGLENQRIISGNVNNIKNGILPQQFKNNSYNHQTIDNNNNVVNWEIDPSSKLVRNMSVDQKNGPFIINQHLDQLNFLGVHTEDSNFMRLINLLKYEA